MPGAPPPGGAWPCTSAILLPLTKNVAVLPLTISLDLVDRAGGGPDRRRRDRGDDRLPDAVDQPVDRRGAVERDRRGEEILCVLAPEPHPDIADIVLVGRGRQRRRIDRLHAQIAARDRIAAVPPPGAAVDRRAQDQPVRSVVGDRVGLAPADIRVLEIFVEDRGATSLTGKGGARDRERQMPGATAPGRPLRSSVSRVLRSRNPSPIAGRHAVKCPAPIAIR